jgi:hypothetical protein
LFGGVFLALTPELNKHVHIENLQLLLIGVGAIWLRDNPNGFGGQISDAGAAIRQALERRRRAGQPALDRASAHVAGKADVPVERVGAR